MSSSWVVRWLWHFNSKLGTRSRCSRGATMFVPDVHAPRCSRRLSVK